LNAAEIGDWGPAPELNLVEVRRLVTLCSVRFRTWSPDIRAPSGGSVGETESPKTDCGGLQTRPVVSLALGYRDFAGASH
jgi:hypothetical protein